MSNRVSQARKSVSILVNLLVHMSIQILVIVPLPALALFIMEQVDPISSQQGPELMNKIELRARVLLTLQVALLGMVTSNLRSVLTSWTATDVYIRMIFDGMVSSDETELASEIETEVISHLPKLSVTCTAISSLSFENVTPLANEVLVFQRAPVSSR